MFDNQKIVFYFLFFRTKNMLFLDNIFNCFHLFFESCFEK